MNPTRMNDNAIIPKYKWTPESTSLLVSIWSDKQVQKQLEYATKPQIIWESVARYMRKKGYNVSAKHCRSRMKQVLVCYREAKKAGTRADVEQYYEMIDKVLKTKRLEHNVDNGIDTVDCSANMKSPTKDIKTTKNLQMRHKLQEPVQSFLRTEALSPTWTVGREYEYPDSPESNETVIARSYGVLSPTRDAAVNTCTEERGVNVRRVAPAMEEPVREEYRQNVFSNYPYGDIPYQNSVQNVQNQIIQENMQQNQNLVHNHMWNQMQQQNMLTTGLGLQNNMNQERMPHFINDATQTLPLINPNTIRQHNHLHQMTMANNRAMPQEPQKMNYGQNVLAGTYRRYQNTVPRPTAADMKQCESTSPDYSPDVTANLNVAFCQSESETKVHNLNETFNRSLQTDNSFRANPEVSVVTNNATCNDDSLLLDCLIESPTPSENGNKSKDTAVNTEDMPNAPVRKKKAQKLEQLVLSAISSQNEVVNKILAAQNDMVTKFLDIDRDRQSRLENRLDHLLNVVHATVLTKNGEAEQENRLSYEEPAIVSLAPPPKPGVVPPKLDLVPPKPCRVPCTIPSTNIELVNTNPIVTRPGVVSPITSPKKPGTIWSKLGPVSQSPFVKAQRRLGLQPVLNVDSRTQSSAERRIAKEVGNMKFNTDTLIMETTRFLEVERQVEEKIKNAEIQRNMGQSLNARRQLFTQREPTAAMILTTAFLQAEQQMAEPPTSYFNSATSSKNDNTRKVMEDNLLAGQGEGYEIFRRLNQPCYVPCDTSTPAKIVSHPKNPEEPYKTVPKQTIQQLAQLVMNSARWRNGPSQNEQFIEQERKQTAHKNEYNTTFSAPKVNAPFLSEMKEEKQPISKGLMYDDNGVYPTEPLNERPNMYKSSMPIEPALQKPVFPMGFTTTMLDNEILKEKPKELIRDNKSLGFVDGMIDRKQQNVRFIDDALAELQRMYIEKNNNGLKKSTEISSGNGYNQNMMDRYIHEIVPKRQFGKDKETDSDDDEFLDTTGTMPPILKRRGSLTSTGTTSTEAAHSIRTNKLGSANCIIS